MVLLLVSSGLICEVRGWLYLGIFAPHPSTLLGRWPGCSGWCVAVRKCIFLSCHWASPWILSLCPPNSQTRAGGDLPSLQN